MAARVRFRYIDRLLDIVYNKRGYHAETVLFLICGTGGRHWKEGYWWQKSKLEKTSPSIMLYAVLRSRFVCLVF